MHTLITRTVIAITIYVFILPFSSMSYATSTIVEACKKIVVAGDSQWPPYVIDEYAMTQEDYDTYKPNNFNVIGAGMELAEKIFNELDVKLEKTTYDDRASLLEALRNGKVDLIVSTYNYAMLAAAANVLSPAWSNDPVTVAVPIAKVGAIKHWEDLAGQPGIMTSSLALDDESESYFSKYLNVKRKGSLAEALQAVQKGEYAYVVGSHLQLNYAIKANLLAQTMTVVSNLSRGADGVHMAFAKKSACLHYSSYVRKRLQDYKNNGTVPKVIEKYMR